MERGVPGVGWGGERGPSGRVGRGEDGGEGRGSPVASSFEVLWPGNIMACQHTFGESHGSVISG